MLLLLLAYNEEENTSYFIHVKKGCDADPARAVCSQVRVCIEEVVRSLTIDQEYNTFDQIYDVATANTDKKRGLHHINLSAVINSQFSSKKELVWKIKNSKINICMAIGETTKRGVNEWGFMKDNEILTDLSHLLDDEPLSIFQDIGLISHQRHHITHMMIDRSQKEIVEIIREKYPKVTKTVIETACKKIYKTTNSREFLRNQFVTKCCINDLYDKFAGYKLSCEKVKLKIMPVQTL